MSNKSKKKRNKQYTGQDAASTPTVHRYTAEVKSPAREWWDGHKRSVKMISGIGGGIILVGWLLSELFRMIFG
jgi:hypothetical protein